MKYVDVLIDLNILYAIGLFIFVKIFMYELYKCISKNDQKYHHLSSVI